MRRIAATLVIMTLLTGVAMAKLHTETIEYKDGNVALEGFLAYDDTITGLRPGVLVVHEWKGLGNYEKSRAEQLANLGYVAFALDMYGKGIRPTTNEEAAAQAGIFYKDIPLMRSRANAGLEVLKRQPHVDTSRIAAIGYCFGGKTVLELARSGAAINGVVSFHGGLATPNPADARNIKCKILVCHGASDPNVPPDQVKAFEDEMTNANVDWQLIAYGGAVHGFTNPANGTDPSKGVAYNERADRRSWQAMRDFFAEIFK
ncbi:dienelactone hydrolase [candidate division GN15 bacterium]|uniref:Dienelactone hydrolase n=1 Tax=candidate division GN15 bacterium TaxID=2072418 RepID=A0A855X4R1_9BACT|nr:MAG: dienelactone hydrolase [candidate division GN15 bacterium]